MNIYGSLPVYISLVYAFKTLISFFKFFYTTFLRRPKDLKTHYGSWALVTGATDGIGKALATNLAALGLNLILISRDPHKLNSVSSDIQSRFPNTLIRVISLDFSVTAEVVIRAVEEAVEGVEVGVLVNNVGVTYPCAMYFDEVDEEVWMRIVNVNVQGMSCVTRMVLKGMVKRGRGAIVNIGSGAAIVVPSHPLFAVYAATKAYVDKLSQSLAVEYKSYGIDVQCQVPLYVATKMTSRVASVEKPSLFTPTAEDYAVAAIRQIGYSRRCSPYWAHSLQWWLASLVPEALLDTWRLSIGIHRRNTSLEKRA